MTRPFTTTDGEVSIDLDEVLFVHECGEQRWAQLKMHAEGSQVALSEEQARELRAAVEDKG